MIKVQVEIPAGETCMHAPGKQCILARYTKKWGAYNCTLHNRILKGEKTPRKCRQCLEYCIAKQREDEKRQ